MKQYIDIVKHVLDNGVEKFPVRKKPDGTFEPVVVNKEGNYAGVKTIACANVPFSHDMKNGFPLLTTKKMAWKGVRVELEGFIRGITSKKWYQERGCHIWDQWANPEKVEEILNKVKEASKEHLGWIPPTKEEIQAQLDDLGPFYGHQWVKWNEVYSENCDGQLKGYNQLANIVDTLRTNPYDRRMVCSAWNPTQLSQMALPPCHWGWNVTVIGDEINLFWVQRSCDLMLGVPFNIASYALLLILLAADSGLVPGNLSAMFVDCHIYENQIEAAKEQITREPYPLCSVWPSNKSGNLKKRFDIFDWTYQDVEIRDYVSHPKLDFGGVAI